MTKDALHPFASGILTWYPSHARDLPWRNTKDPYVIWLSEIILQQTRVAQGLPYFNSLLSAFPSVFALAQAEESVLFRHWQGLGYYSRARNLHKAAKIVVSQYAGLFPSSYQELIKLPGVGPYTAAAIASFSFGEAVPVVDGNAFRILSRYFGIETDIMRSSARKEFTELAQTLIPQAHAATFNQAIMEFGSLQCSPVPNCQSCPLRISCVAFATKQTQVLPIKSKGKALRTRYFNYFFVVQQHKFLVRKRSEKDIWQGLWEFVVHETDAVSDLQTAIGPNHALLAFPNTKLNSPQKHLLSHQCIVSQAWLIQVPDNVNISIPHDFQWMDAQEFENCGKPTLLVNLITDNMILHEWLQAKNVYI
jgi:A/G-specific adenine glycosylase